MCFVDSFQLKESRWWTIDAEGPGGRWNKRRTGRACSAYALRDLNAPSLAMMLARHGKTTLTDWPYTTQSPCLTLLKAFQFCARMPYLHFFCFCFCRSLAQLKIWLSSPINHLGKRSGDFNRIDL